MPRVQDDTRNSGLLTNLKNKTNSTGSTNSYTTSAGNSATGKGGSFASANYKAKPETGVKSGTLRKTAELPVVPKTTSPSSTSSYGSDAVPDYYSEMLAQFEAANAKAKDDVLKSIESQLQAALGTYEGQKRSVSDQWDRLIDQNEVNKFRAHKLARERQANLGIGDSGLGRWDRTNIDTSYDATTGQHHRAKQQAIDEIENLIAQEKATAERQKAEANNTYANALLQWKLANLSGSINLPF